MRVTFTTSTVETLEYLRLVNTILRNNQEVDETVKAFNTLKEYVESLGKRVNSLEATTRRNKVCR